MAPPVAPAPPPPLLLLLFPDDEDDDGGGEEGERDEGETDGELDESGGVDREQSLSVELAVDDEATSTYSDVMLLLLSWFPLDL